jgi:hypothetical protein
MALLVREEVAELAELAVQVRQQQQEMVVYQQTHLFLGL